MAFHLVILLNACFQLIAAQWYDPWLAVNQLSLQSSLNAADVYLQEIENQAINNSNIALKLVVTKAVEAQQVIMLARGLTIFTVEQQYMLNLAAYQASAEVEASRLNVIKRIQELLLQSRELTQLTRNSLMLLKSTSVWSQLLMPILRQDLLNYKTEMEKRAQELNKALKIYNNNVDTSICRLRLVRTDSKSCELLFSPFDSIKNSNSTDKSHAPRKLLKLKAEVEKNTMELAPKKS